MGFLAARKPRPSYRPALEPLEDRSLLSVGTNGIVITPELPEHMNAVALQSDGKIVVAGGFSVPGVGGFSIARYNADGTLDTSSNSGGSG